MDALSRDSLAFNFFRIGEWIYLYMYTVWCHHEKSPTIVRSPLSNTVRHCQWLGYGRYERAGFREHRWPDIRHYLLNKLRILGFSPSCKHGHVPPISDLRSPDQDSFFKTKKKIPPDFSHNPLFSPVFLSSLSILQSVSLFLTFSTCIKISLLFF